MEREGATCQPSRIVSNTGPAGRPPPRAAGEPGSGSSGFPAPPQGHAPTWINHKDLHRTRQVQRIVFLHSTFGTSRLVRLLGPWSPVEADRSGMDFAERTSLWVGPLEAIRLQAAHQPVRTPAATDRKAAIGRAATTRSLEEDLQRVHGVLARAIAQDPLALANLKPGDPDFSYTPFRQRHLELQRQMEQMTSALRDHLRQAIGRASPRLRQLAELDAALEQVLAVREQKLLPTTAGLLERRFHQLRRAHQQEQAAAGQPDDPSAGQLPGDWLHAFGQDWRNALLAELDLRLEPATGLLDALRNEHPHQA